jgi:uncharacterized membrane-anchored protein
MPAPPNDDDEAARHSANVAVLIVAVVIVIVGGFLLHLMSSYLKNERCREERRHGCDGAATIDPQ